MAVPGPKMSGAGSLPAAFAMPPAANLPAQVGIRDMRFNRCDGEGIEAFS